LFATVRACELYISMLGYHSDSQPTYPVYMSCPVLSNASRDLFRATAFKLLIPGLWVCKLLVQKPAWRFDKSWWHLNCRCDKLLSTGKFKCSQTRTAILKALTLVGVQSLAPFHLFCIMAVGSCIQKCSQVLNQSLKLELKQRALPLKSSLPVLPIG